MTPLGLSSDELWEKLEWNHQFWIPARDVKYKKSEFYEMEVQEQYGILIYYSLLLVFGNDVYP